MTPSLRAPSRRALVACVVLSAACASSSALAEIFKCSAKDGTPLYQNFPCNVDSLGSMPSPAAVIGAPVLATSASAGEATKGKPVAVSAALAAAPVKPLGQTGLNVGMTEDQVKAVLGEPEQRLEDEQRTGRVYIWRYGNRQDVIFDTRRHVLSVQPYSEQ
jgi:hypothetical protein